MKTMRCNFHIVKKLLWLLCFSAIFAPVMLMGQAMRHQPNSAFGPGERLFFRAYYSSALTGNVLAGDASLEIQPTLETIGNRNAMRVVGTMHSRGVFSLFFRVNNRFESLIDNAAIAPLFFMRRIEEGRYRRNQDVRFNHTARTATSNTTTVSIPSYVQDLISVFYFSRTLPLQNPSVGDQFVVDFFLDDSVYVTRIVFDGYERITTRLGTFNTMRFKPMVLTGKVFSQPYPMTLWISNDMNRIPVRIQTGLSVGSLKLELSEFSGLRNPITSFVISPRANNRQ